MIMIIIIIIIIITFPELILYICAIFAHRGKVEVQIHKNWKSDTDHINLVILFYNSNYNNSNFNNNNDNIIKHTGKL